MTWFWQRKSDKQAECDASSTLWLPPEMSSNPVLIRCMYKQLMCHAFNKQRFVFCDLISSKSCKSPLLIKEQEMLRMAEYHVLWITCLQPSSVTHQLTLSITTSQKSSNKCPACCKLSSPTFPIWTLIQAPNQKGSCHHWSVMLWTLQRQAWEKPSMFDQSCILLMKPSISQLEAANTPSSPRAPLSYLPSTFLCILILCMSTYDCFSCPPGRQDHV